MAIDFKRIFNDARIPIRTDVNKFWVNCNCPWCVNPADTHFNGGFNYISPRYSCWRCGSHNYYDTLSKLLNIPINQISQFIKDYTYISSEKEIKRIAQAEYLNLPGFPLNEQEKQYLINRGYNINYLINKFHIRGGGITGEWSYRIILPIYYKRVLVSWTGRTILSKEELKQYKAMGIDIPRYKNLDIENSVIAAKDIFFNLDNSTEDSVILVEGPFDVMKMGTQTICSLGTSTTREQELFLKTRYKNIFICFDNESSAQLKAKKLGMNLASIGLNVEVVNICEPFGKNDPGELSYNEVMEIKKELGFNEL